MGVIVPFPKVYRLHPPPEREPLDACGLLTREEADHILFDQWERADGKHEDILPPILQRVYRAQQ
jgi:hypothetical protein